MAKMKVTRNHQVTISEDVRKKLSIEEEDYISIETTGETLAITKPSFHWGFHEFKGGERRA